MRFLTVVCALALVIGLATVASAEVQNIKVSGDLTVRSLWRTDYDCRDNVDLEDAQNYFMSTAELQVDADLTDNVSTTVRIFNQRDWDDESLLCGYDSSDPDDLDILLDLAYVELKEMLYSPLTVKIGRQDLWFGKGLVIGAKPRDPAEAIAAEEYTTLNSFDAIRLTLDYDPWIVDLVYSKIEENVIQGLRESGKNDDVDLYGANIGYAFDSYNGEAEAYIWAMHDRSEVTSINAANEVDTVGIRGSFDPIEDATLGGELAYQFGDFRYYDGTTTGTSTRDRSAFAVDVYGEYRFTEARWTPVVGLEYIYLSGEKDDQSTDAGDWNAWNPMFIGKSMSAIRQFQNVYYRTVTRADHGAAAYTAPGTPDIYYEIGPAQDSGMTNLHQISATGSVRPTENLTLAAKYSHYIFDEKPRSASSDDHIGDEIDVTLTYDYTEDVTFSLLTAWFFPGDYFPGGEDDNVTDVVGTMTVSF